MNWITLTNAARQLRIDSRFIRRLVHLGHLAIRDGKLGHEICLAAGVDRAGLMEIVYERHAPCTTRSSIEAVASAARLLTKTEAGAMPAAFMDDAVSFMVDEGIDLDMKQVHLLTGCAASQARTIAAQFAAEPTQKPKLTRYRSSGTCQEAAVLDRLPEHLRQAPGTYFSPTGKHDADRPTNDDYGRLLLIRNERMFINAAITNFRAAAIGTSQAERCRRLQRLRRLDHQVPELAEDPFELRAQFEAFLGNEWQASKQASLEDSATIGAYDNLTADFNSYLHEALSEEQRKAFAPLKLPLPVSSRSFFEDVRSSLGKLKTSRLDAHQVKIAKVLENPLELLLVAKCRMEEHQKFRDFCRGKIDELIASGEPLTKPMRFIYSMETRLIDSNLERCLQSCHIAIWTWDLLHKEIVRTAGFSASNMFKPHLLSETQDVGRGAYAIEYLGVTPDQPEGPVQTPLVAEVMQSCVLRSEYRLDEDQYSRQKAGRAKWGLRPKVSGYQALCPYANRSRSNSALLADQHLRSTRPDGSTGRVLIIPLDEFTHNLMFARTAILIAADTGARISEILQAPSRASDFEQITDDETGRVSKSYKALGKNNKDFHPLLSPETFSVLTELISENAQRWHAGRLPPAVDATRELRKRGFKEPRQYAFTYQDRMLSLGNLNDLVHVLFFGWHGVCTHDIRHMFNSLAREAGVAREVRQQWLGHDFAHTTDGYGKPTPGQVAREQRTLQQQRNSRASVLLAESWDSITPAMRDADRRMRLAAISADFWQAEGDPAEEENARAGMRRWADVLAAEKAGHTGGSKVIDVNVI